MDFADIGQSVVKVLIAGLAFGAGLPAIFSLGILLWSKGSDEVEADGSVRKGNPAALVGAGVSFLVVVAAIVLGVLWITQKSLHHYFGITIFG